MSELIKERYGNPKIIISEITPRNDENDPLVIECNQTIKTYVESNEHIFLAKQSGLRTDDGRHFQDEKHITKYAVPIFCASLKRTLRHAYGIRPKDNNNRHNSNNNIYHNNNNNNNYRGRGGNFNNWGGRFQSNGGNRSRGGGRNSNRGGHQQRQGSNFPDFTNLAELKYLIREIVTDINTGQS